MDNEEREQIFNDYFVDLKNKNLYVSAIIDNSELLGFMILNCNPIGKGSEYIELKMFHVSQQYRNKGIGKLLFDDAKRKANELNIPKLYLSAHSAYETQKFYESLGCIDAIWKYLKAVELEPWDIQMEYSVRNS